MEIALYGYKVHGRNIVTIHACEVTPKDRHPELLCNAFGVSDDVNGASIDHYEFLTKKEAPKLEIRHNLYKEKVLRNLTAIFREHRKEYFKGMSFNFCGRCRNIIGQHDFGEFFRRFDELDKSKENEVSEGIILGKQVTRKELKIADAGFEGFAAIRLGASPPIDMELDANGRAKSTQDLDSLVVDLDEEFVNFNEETFCATDSTLEGLFEYLAREVYQVNPEEEILQDLRDGILVIVKVQTIPINIVMEEKIIRDVIKIKERK